MPERGSYQSSVAQSLKQKQKRKQFPRFLYLTTINGALGALSYGYVLGSNHGAEMILEKEYSFKGWEKLFWYATFLTALCSTIPAGPLADTIGRKHSLMTSSCLVTLGTVVLVSAPNMSVVIVGLTIRAVGLALAAIISPVYLLECAPKEIRSSQSCMYTLLYFGGMLLGDILSVLLLPVHQGWRILYGITAIPNIIQFICFTVYKFPQSPRYLVMVGKIDKTYSVLDTIREPGQSHRIEVQDIRTVVEQNKDKKGFVAWKYIFTIPHTRKALMLACSLDVFMQLSGMRIVYHITQVILIDYGFTETTSLWLGNLTTCLIFFGSYLPFSLVDTWGPKRLLTYSFYACAVATAFLSLATFLGSVYLSPTVSAVFDDGSHGPCSETRNCYQCVYDDDREPCAYCAPKKNNLEKAACVDIVIDKQGKVYAEHGRCGMNSTELKDMLIMHETCPNSHFSLFFIGLLFFMFTYAIGAGPLCQYQDAELLPLWARSIGRSMGLICRQLTVIILVPRYRDYGTPVNTYIWFICFTVSNCIAGKFISTYFPEFICKPLEWIQCLFMEENDRKQFIDLMIKNRIEPEIPIPAEPTSVLSMMPALPEEEQLIRSLKDGTPTDPDNLSKLTMEVQSLKLDAQSIKSKASVKSKEDSEVIKSVTS